MSRRWLVLGTLLVIAAVWPGRARAQESILVSVGGGGGGVLPVNEISDFFDFGWFAQANVGLDREGWPARLRFDIVYRSLAGNNVLGADNDLRILGGLLNLELTVLRAGERGGLFLGGGPGLYYLDVDESIEPLEIFADNGLRLESGGQTEFGIFGAIAYKFDLTDVLLSLEVKYEGIFTDGGTTELIPFGLVVEVPLNRK